MNVMIRFSLAEWKIKGANLLPFSETRKVWVSRWEYITGNFYRHGLLLCGEYYLLHTECGTGV